MDFDTLEQIAEQRVTEALGRYSVAALTAGIIFACLMLGWAVTLLTGGSLVMALFAVAVAVMLIWLVALLRTARAALKAPVLAP